MFRVDTNFIGIFKLGDNINYNLNILKKLYSIYNDPLETEKHFLLKPIIILNISITEAVLYDFHYRVKEFTNEGVTNLGHSVITYIRGKRIDKLKRYIESAKKHNLFDMNDVRFYDLLDYLRKLRNRTHIQDYEKDLEADDIAIFTEQNKILSEKVLEKVVKVLSAKYPRSDYHSQYVDDFIFPWEENFK